jgi:hypothetical protein
MSKLNFDAKNFRPESDVLPEGEYLAAITESEIKVTKAGTGHYLELRWTVLEGEEKGRPVWQRINIDNPSKKAVAMAQRDLWELCHALGVLQLSDSSQLHDIPVNIQVRIETGGDGYDDQNVIGRFPKPQASASDSSGDVPF